MSDHPSHDDLLSHHFGLLEGNARAQVAEHVARCPACERRLQQIAEKEGEMRPGEGDREDQGQRGARRIIMSPATLLVVSTLASAFLTPMTGWLGLAPFVAGGLAVLVWMHAAVASVEIGWVELQGINWNAALPADREERARFLEGLRLSMTASILPAVQLVRGLLKASLGLGMAGLVAALVLRTVAPDVSGVIIGQKAPMLVGAGLLGLLIVAVGWTILRLRRIAEAVGQVLDAISRALSEAR